MQLWSGLLLSSVQSRQHMQRCIGQTATLPCKKHDRHALTRPGTHASLEASLRRDGCRLTEGGPHLEHGVVCRQVAQPKDLARNRRHDALYPPNAKPVAAAARPNSSRRAKALSALAASISAARSTSDSVRGTPRSSIRRSGTNLGVERRA